ncbi:MAG: class III cytochrome C family protein [Ignavibacteria bacterium]|nr:class III cytochrome C family protein [Ignavibacteria bacterium]
MNKVIIIALTALCVWLVYEYPHAMINPGDLVEGHQKLKENCLSCHKPFWGIESDKCTDCHKLENIGKDTLNITGISEDKQKKLFHQYLSEQKCASCHTDHAGLNAGISMRFDHELLTETILNQCVNCHNKLSDNIHKNLSSDCSKCHQTKGWKSDVLFNHEMINADEKNNCVSCHVQPDDSFHSMIKDNCNKCHGTVKWTPSTFNHSNFFILDKDHNTKCITCHTNNNLSSYTCYGCHEHSVNNIMDEHREEGISSIDDCVSCHKSADEDDMKMDGKKGKEFNKNEKGNTKESDKRNDNEGEKENNEEEDDD